MSKISEIISEMGYEELKEVQSNLNQGNIENQINIRLEQLLSSGGTVCPVCHTELANPDEGAFTLFFGPKDFRKKASFCAMDCLEYFVRRLKGINNKRIRKERV